MNGLLNRLDAVKQTGARQWLARCPAHDDRSPSLTVKECDDGRTLLYCHAGCTAADVVAAVGLELKDLFPESTLPKVKRKEHSIRASHNELESALYHELLVLTQIVGIRVGERQMARNKAFRTARPDWRPMPREHWDREILAAKRIKAALGVLYG